MSLAPDQKSSNKMCVITATFFVFFCFTVLSVEDQTQHEKCLFIIWREKGTKLLLLNIKSWRIFFWYFKIAQMLACNAVVVDAKTRDLANQSLD